MTNNTLKYRLAGIRGLTVAAVVLMSLCCLQAEAGSATWNQTPNSSDWNTAANWTPESVPDEMEDVATFGSSTVTDVFVSSYVSIGAIVFGADANAYTIAPQIGLYGAGVTNNSGVTQNFICSQGMGFFEESTAGDNVVYSNVGGLNTGAPDNIGFLDSSRAGSATFINSGSSSEEMTGGEINFFNTASADASMIVNNGPTDGTSIGAVTAFSNSSTAANSTIIVNPGADVYFFVNSTAGNATIDVEGGALNFEDQSDGGTARIIVNSGVLNIDSAKSAKVGVTIGSLEGTHGTVTLSRSLTAGSNELDTVFGGNISGSAQNSSLTKIGGGTLTLSKANTYSAGTTVSDGALLVTNKSGSATGTGAVTVAGGTLGGGGIISGSVTVGTGSGAGASLAPAGGSSTPAKLTTKKAIVLQNDSTYNCLLSGRGRQVKSDQVVAKGVTIDSSAQFTLTSQVQGKLRQGISFTLISNTVSTPISGTFANLADGTTITVGSTTFKASYEGGDGNDLVLTVQ